VWQPSQDIHQHQVNLGYQILAKNDFGKIKKRINLGYFNKKTNFMVGEKNSLLWWDATDKKILTKNISDIKAEPKRYFMLYDLNYIMDKDSYNETIKITKKETQENIEIKLTSQFGRDIGELLLKSDPTNLEIPENFNFLKALIKTENNRINLNKQILVNSNPKFLLGILEGYVKEERAFILKNNINIYNFTYILNLLGAQYSIRTLADNKKQIRFRLPIFLKSSSKLKENFFRPWKYFFDGDQVVLRRSVEISVDATEPDFFQIVNSGLIELVPAKDLVFTEVNDQVMYDLTMSRADATNYSLPCFPYCKNSDGDVLGAIAITSEDAAKEAIRKFSTELKENFLSLSTGEVQSWGVKLDSQVGLYVATK
jgi:hypothetical protein